MARQDGNTWFVALPGNWSVFTYSNAGAITVNGGVDLDALAYDAANGLLWGPPATRCCGWTRPAVRCWARCPFRTKCSSCCPSSTAEPSAFALSTTPMSQNLRTRRSTSSGSDFTRRSSQLLHFRLHLPAGFVGIGVCAAHRLRDDAIDQLVGQHVLRRELERLGSLLP